jgi:aminoglycoside/choline kinase family phosphotransferase
MTITRAAEAEAAHTRLQAYLKRSGLAARGARVVPLTGDASDRRYFRVLVPDGPSTVLALHSGPIDFGQLPFVNVAELLGRMPLPIPEILDHADDLGLLLLEDLGDVTLQAHLGAAPPAEHVALYRQAVAIIDVLQCRGAELQSPNYTPFGIAFDVEKLSWELDFFAKHFLQAYRGVELAPAARDALVREFHKVVEELAAEPRVLCHRDYHSRNLMLHLGRLYLIDFQDARMGPDTYDLVSLLRDSYVDLTEQTVDDLIAYYLALSGRTGDQQAFRARFDLMALQRNLKALGTFGYQTTARRNPVYIQYIPRTLRYTCDNLKRYPRFAQLHEILAAHVDELR